MSMINDALRRARHSRPTGAGPADGPSFRPVDHRYRNRNEGLFSLAILLGAIFVLSGILIWAWNHGGRVNLTVRAHADTPVLQPTFPALATPAATVPAPAPTAEPPTPADTTATPAPAPDTNTTLAAAAPPPPTYKLQGIFFRSRNPSAVINGKTVFVGDRVGDAHVTAISKDTVTVATPGGGSTVLDLPQ